MHKLLLPVAFLILSTTPALSQIIQDVRALKGLKGVNVFFSEPLNMQEHGINSLEAVTELELKLRKAGINVLTIAEANETPGMPVLSITVRALKSENGSSTISLALDLHQLVQLKRDPSTVIEASTWHVDMVLILGANRLGTVRQTISEGIDIFINAFLAANQKKGRTVSGIPAYSTTDPLTGCTVFNIGSKQIPRPAIVVNEKYTANIVRSDNSNVAIGRAHGAELTGLGIANPAKTSTCKG